MCSLVCGCPGFCRMCRGAVSRKLSVITGSDNVVSGKSTDSRRTVCRHSDECKGALIVGVENNSGPQIGDMIVAVNGEKVSGPADVEKIVGDKGKKVEITVMRNKKPSIMKSHRTMICPARNTN